MGQRGVAKATREKFGLSKFSHSTLCRTFKALENAIAKASAPSENNGSDTACERQDKSEIDAASSKPEAPKRIFPSAADTAERRREMAAFIKSTLEGNKTEDIIEISRIIVKYWYDKYKRLII